MVFDNQGEQGHFLVFARLNEGFTLDEAVELEGGKPAGRHLRRGRRGAGQVGDVRDQEAARAGQLRDALSDSVAEGPHYTLGQLEEFEIG